MLRGVTTPADYSPSVTNGDITVLGQGKLPEAKRMQFDPLLTGKEDGHWAEMEGVIRSGEIRNSGVALNIAAHGGTILGVLANYPPDWQRRLVDARVTLHGVIGAIFNERRQSIGMRMFLPNFDQIRIDQAPPSDPFALPLSQAVSIGQYQPDADLDRWIHVRATVIGMEPGGSVYVSDATGSLAVQAAAGRSPQTGDEIDIVGFPGGVDGRPGLQDAVWRPAGARTTLRPPLVTSDDVLPEEINTQLGGYALRASRRFDLKLIQIEGTLLQTSSMPGGQTFILRSGKREFTATLTGAHRNTWPQSGDGSKLRLTGVCLINYDQYRRAQSFRLVLRDPDEIVVLARPPWWNLRLALWSLGLVALFFMGTLAWVSVLRRQVARQTLELRLANESLRWLSTQDALTGVSNRRKFDETLDREYKQSQRNGRPLSLLMADIDYFKTLNDAWGHQQGDRCLTQVAKALESILRGDNDLVARYGGEEFAVILPETDAAAALALAERIRHAVECLGITHPGSPAGKWLSLSVGVATHYPERSSIPADLIAAADKALYEAKKLGRNRAISIEPEGALIGT